MLDALLLLTKLAPIPLKYPLSPSRIGGSASNGFWPYATNLRRVSTCVAAAGRRAGRTFGDKIVADDPSTQQSPCLGIRMCLPQTSQGPG